MSIVWIILVGFIVGVIAKFLTPGRDPGGFLLTAVLGIAGSMLATFLGRFFGMYQPDQAAGFIGAIVGSVVILAVYHAARS